MKQQVAIWSQPAIGHLADRRVERGEGAEQAVDVLVGPSVNHIEVLSGGRGPVKDRGRTPLEARVEFIVIESGEEAVKISDARMRHVPL